MIDQITPLYRAALLPWLINEFVNYQDCIRSDLRYALVEILQMNDSNSMVPMEQRIDYLYRNLKELILESNDEAKKRIDDAIGLIIKQGKNTSYL
ncbi:MAG TPA: hypothetical protein EYQ26_17915 [Rhodospirillales bacterium]|nr:hypothetical protein [Rhodospirillales bacterium]